MKEKNSKNRRPDWLRTRLPSGSNYLEIRGLLRNSGLNTVCEEARCPNIGECFNKRTATFLILGSICTRGCRFCNVNSGQPKPVDPGEPERVAAAAQRMGLRHIVITSVTRDDLQDGGAGIYAKTIASVRQHNPDSTIEVLIPDFAGSSDALNIVVREMPDIINHNIETVPRLYNTVRPGAVYKQSLMLLQEVRKNQPAVIAKSGLMLGVGEVYNEIIDVMSDLREAGCEILTIGQYLSPGRGYLAVERFYHPDEFNHLRMAGIKMGFTHVESGPLVRSSYHAEQQARQGNRLTNAGKSISV